MSLETYLVPAKRVLHDHVIPCFSTVQLFLVASYCLKVYYEDVVHRNVKHFAYISFLVMVANACAGLLRYANDDYFDLRILLDYFQLILTAPLIASEFLTINEVVPPEIAYIPTGLAFALLLFYIILDYRRQDLTDLNVIICVMIFCLVGYGYNVYASLAGLNFGFIYFFIKRTECCLEKANQSNLLMSIFAVLSLLTLSPNCLNNEV